MAAATLVVSSANAQQRPTPLPSGGGAGSGSALKPDHKLPTLHYPTPAATYEQYVQYYLKLIRAASSRYHVASADTNKVILFLRDCSARVEADGYVTEREAHYCNSQTMAMVHDIATPYIMQAAGDAN